MPITEASLEDELALANSLIQSEGWKWFVSKWAKLLRECENSLLDPDNPNRDWSAGLVSGYKRLLSYPNNRVETIQRELTKRSKQ